MTRLQTTEAPATARDEVRARADVGLKRALVHHNDGISEMRIVWCRIAGRNTRGLDGFSKRIPALECALSAAGEWLSPKPLHNGAIGVTPVNV